MKKLCYYLIDRDYITPTWLVNNLEVYIKVNSI